MTERVAHSEGETAALGRDLARHLTPGTFVLLLGPLGAGKTAFVRGLADGLGCDPEDVSSPTFTLIQEYRGRRLLLEHVDLYRLGAPEVPDLGLDEMAGEGRIVAVEWADRWTGWPDDAVRVEFEIVDGTTRRIRIHGRDRTSEVP